MELIGILRRRWILTASLFLVTLFGTAFALFKLPWTYQSQASIVLLAPPSSLKTYGDNPYMAFDSSLTVAADVLRRNMMSTDVASSLAAHGYPSSYLVAQAPDTSGPVLLITITGSSKAAVQHTLTGVTNETQTVLHSIQSGIAPGNRIGETLISASPQASRLAGKKAKPLLVVFALGLVVTVTVPVLVDSLRRSKIAAKDVPYRGQTIALPALSRTTGRLNRPAISAEDRVPRSGQAPTDDAQRRSEFHLPPHGGHPRPRE